MPKLCLLLAVLLLPCPTNAQQNGNGGFEQRLAEGRQQYFAGLQGDRAAAAKAQVSFAALSRDFPGDPLVEVYSGSLELLDAAHTWAIWDKRKLADEGLGKMDQAVNRAPSDLEVRFIRAASDWHLPFFFKRRTQAEDDFAFIAPRAEAAVKASTLPPELAAAALDYYGQVLIDRSDNDGAKQAFEAAVRIDGSSTAGRDALKRLRTE